MLFEIRDTLFPTNLKPIKPQVNYDITVFWLMIIFTIIRILSITSTFIFLYYLSKYKKLLKKEVLNLGSSADPTPIKSKGYISNEKNDANLNDRTEGKIESVNRANSEMTDSILEEKTFQDDLEPQIRVSEEELNQKIKSGDIFVTKKLFNE